MHNGHDLQQILTYSLRRMEVFTDAIVAREKEKIHTWAITMRNSQGMEAKAFLEFLKELQGDE